MDDVLPLRFSSRDLKKKLKDTEGVASFSLSTCNDFVFNPLMYNVPKSSNTL